MKRFYKAPELEVRLVTLNRTVATTSEDGMDWGDADEEETFGIDDNV